jgi:predicted NAD-dependent protein-ADP-ribosyltransferase YbiA (DUF1768 family)
MKTLLQPDRLILIPETAEERADLTVWKTTAAGHVFLDEENSGKGLTLRDLGPRESACREPLHISNRIADPKLRLISNFAATPFELDGEEYASVEGFWQGLKFADPRERRRVALLAGNEAKNAGSEPGYAATVSYANEQIVVGTWVHWQLMQRACEAKFSQHAASRAALVSTDPRPLQHRLRRDSRAIPGVIMAEIWMRIREKLAGKAS